MTDTRRELAYLAFRVLVSPIFLVSGLAHLVKPAALAARLESAPFGDLATALAPATVLIVASGVALFAGGLALLLGFKTRLAALGLVAVLIPITITVQIGNPSGPGPLLKNVGLLGALVQLAAAGGGRFALDALPGLRRRATAATVVGALAFLAAPLVHAVQPDAPGERVGFLVQKPKQLKVVLETSRQMLAGEGFAATDVRVVVCGEAIGAVVKGGSLEKNVEVAATAGVGVSACGITLAQKKIDPKRLTPGIEVVPNGLLEILKLQALGYRTVEL